MDKQPSENQIRELWEWCGWEQTTNGFYAHPSIASAEYYHYESGGKLPPIDLNNLFKYAVPKVSHAEVATGCFAGQTGNFRAQVKTNPPQLYERWSSASAETPALALFWAIMEVING